MCKLTKTPNDPQEGVDDTDLHVSLGSYKREHLGAVMYNPTLFKLN